MALSMAACGNKNLGEEELNNVFKDVDEALVKVEETATGEKEYGYEVSLSVTPEEALLDLLGLEESETIKVNATINAGDITSVDIAALLNKVELLKVNAITDKENVYVSIPGYADEYLKVTAEDAGLDAEQVTAAANSVDEIMPAFKDLSKNIRKSIVIAEEDAIEKDYEIGDGDFEITGTSYLFEVDKDALADAYKTFYDALYDYLYDLYENSLTDDDKEYYELDTEEAIKEYVSEEVEDMLQYELSLPSVDELEEALDEEIDEITLRYVTNKDNEKAWELHMTSEEDDEMTIVYVKTKEAFAVYGFYDDEDPEYLIYSEPDEVSDDEKTGVIYFEDEEVAEYEKTKEYTQLAINVDDIDLEITKYEGKEVHYEFALEAEGVEVKAELTKSGKTTTITASVEAADVDMASLQVEVKETGYKAPKIPNKSLEMEEWMEELDTDKLQEDLEEKMEDSELLQSLLDM